jgi:hypothetical protein
MRKRAPCARDLLSTVRIAVDGAGSDRGTSWRTFAGPFVVVVYGSALASTSWSSAMDGDGGSSPIALAVLTILVWLALTVLCGYLLPTAAFVLIPIAVAVPAFIGERGEEFDNELRYFNWLLLVVINMALVIPGAWLARRRS